MVGARLDKTGLRVLCGVKDCGGELAWVLEHGVYPDHQFGRRCVWFPPGWAAREDGVWALTGRAAKRKRQGRRPANRGQPGNRTVARQPANYGKEPTGWLPPLPVEAVCPRCGFRQTLDPDVLDVEHREGPIVVRGLDHPDEIRRWFHHSV